MTAGKNEEKGQCCAQTRSSLQVVFINANLYEKGGRPSFPCKWGTMSHLLSLPFVKRD